MNFRVVRNIPTCFLLILCVVISLSYITKVECINLKAELRTKQLLQNIRSHLAAQVEEVVQQKECDTGLTLCEEKDKSKEEEEEDEEEGEEMPPPPKIRGHHKPMIKVNPKDVIQTMIHKANKPLVKRIEAEKELESKKIKVTVTKHGDDDDEDDGEDDDDKKSKKKGRKMKRDKTKDKEESQDEDEGEEGFPQVLPVFAATSPVVQNAICRKHSRVYMRQLKRYKLWALMMYDSSGKLPSGILQGNVNQFGDFDQCLSVNAVFKDSKSKRIVASDGSTGIEGKYCLASIDIESVSESKGLNQALLRSQSFNMFRSSVDDPGHFIPKFSTINWALCVPSSCHAKDIENALQDSLAEYNETSGLMFSVRVDKDMCQVKDDTAWSFSFIAMFTILFYGSVVATSAYATYKDIYVKTEDVASEQAEGEEDGKDKEGEGTGEEKESSVKEEKKEEEEEKVEEEDGEKVQGAEEIAEVQEGVLKRLLMCFSLKRSLNQLLSDEVPVHDIDCTHGLRSIATIMLFLVHRVLPLSYTPFTNRVALTQASNESTSVLLRAPFMFTDCLLLINSFLLSFSMNYEHATTGRTCWLKRLVVRVLRLLPALLVVLLYYSYVYEHTGSGPLWSVIVRKNSDLCKESMWKNLLFVNNFFSFDSMCAPHTYQISVELQLSLLTPLLVYLLSNNVKIGYGVLSAVLLTCTILRFWITSSNELSLLIYHGIPISQMYDTWNMLNSQAIYRLVPYIIGVALGHYICYYGSDANLSKSFVAMGWITAFCFGFLTMVTPVHLADRSYQYDPDEAAQYATLSPLAWSLMLAWVIFACCTGYSGRVNEYLSHKLLLVFSRISYPFFLVQFIVFYHGVSVKRIPEVFSLLSSVQVTEFIMVTGIALVLTLLLTIPMLDVENIVMEKLDTILAGKGDSEKPKGEEGEEEGGQESVGDLEEVDLMPDEEIMDEEEYEEHPLRRYGRISFHEVEPEEEGREEEELVEEGMGGATAESDNFWGHDED